MSGHRDLRAPGSLPQGIQERTRCRRMKGGLGLLDPDEPHVHLGPIGVAPDLQRQGIGTALMQRYVEYIEAEKAAGYLETDRRDNVEFYRKFGFVVQREAIAIGAPTWHMWRPSAG